MRTKGTNFKPQLCKIRGFRQDIILKCLKYLSTLIWLFEVGTSLAVENNTKMDLTISLKSKFWACIYVFAKIWNVVIKCQFKLCMYPKSPRMSNFFTQWSVTVNIRKEPLYDCFQSINDKNPNPVDSTSLLSSLYSQITWSNLLTITQTVLFQ